MKIITIILIVLNFLTVFAVNAVCENSDDETENFIRLHIRANSNSENDQELKLKVRDAILGFTGNKLCDESQKTEAYKIIQNSIEDIEEVAEKTVVENGFNYDVNVSLKQEYFERREYEGFYLPADVYDSLIIEIGTGEGDNWWCVIFPAVCISGSSVDIKKLHPDEDGATSVINIEAIPEKFRLAENPIPQKVKFEFWIVKFFKNLFGNAETE